MKHADFIKPDIRSLLLRGTVIDKERWESLRMNSYEREALIPQLDNQVLAETIQYTVKNCRPVYGPVAVTYDEALQTLALEAAKRLVLHQPMPWWRRWRLAFEHLLGWCHTNRCAYCQRNG